MGHWTAQFTIFNPDYKNNICSRLLTLELTLFYGLHELCGQKIKYFVIWRFRRPKFEKKGHLVRFSSRSFRGKRNRKGQKEHPNLLHPGFSGVMTGLNREKRCKLAAVFVQNLLSVFTEVEYSFVREFLQFISRIYLFFRDLCIFFNAYGNGNHRARHAAAGLLAKTRYNFTRLRSVMFLHGPWTSGWQILSIVFIVIEAVGLFSRPFLPKNGSFPLQQRMADQILTQLKQHPDAWTRVDTILEYSNNQQTKVLWTGNLWLFF